MTRFFKKIMKLIDIFLFKYVSYIILFFLFLVYVLYFGVCALLGNKVVLKMNGYVLLSEEAATINIVFGVCAILYLFYAIYKEEIES